MVFIYIMNTMGPRCTPVGSNPSNVVGRSPFSTVGNDVPPSACMLPTMLPVAVEDTPRY